MSISIITNATKISIAIQALTDSLGVYGLTMPLASKDAILRQILGLEIIVQIIEFVFYIGFLSILDINTLTTERYYDWFISTPIMLFTISVYFFYVNFIENLETTEETVGEPFGLFEFTKNNLKPIAGFIFLNFLMLLFGYLAELGIMNKFVAFILGTFALSGAFGIIYEYYAKYSKKTRDIFWIMFGIWALYGVAFLCSPVIKNIGYTILDLFAKNFFGVFLYYVINKKRI